MPDTKTIAVLGAGTMGNGIAHVCARGGFNVLLYDVDQQALIAVSPRFEQTSPAKSRRKSSPSSRPTRPVPASP